VHVQAPRAWMLGQNDKYLKIAKVFSFYFAFTDDYHVPSSAQAELQKYLIQVLGSVLDM
jgi:hypothetical protein